MFLIEFQNIQNWIYAIRILYNLSNLNFQAVKTVFEELTGLTIKCILFVVYFTAYLSTVLSLSSKYKRGH